MVLHRIVSLMGELEGLGRRGDRGDEGDGIKRVRRGVLKRPAADRVVSQLGRAMAIGMCSADEMVNETRRVADD